MSENTSTSEIRATWESAAPGWAKWEADYSRHLGEVTDRLIGMAGVASGMHVLDVACGAGNQTLRAAERVGPAGRVTASDISSEMLNHVQSNAKQRGLTNVETHESPAEELAATGHQFDAAISRFGLMLFASPRRALARIHDVLKPHGRFAAVVFTTPDKSPFFSEPMRILLRHSGKPNPEPGAPGLFALGGEGVLEGILRDSGFMDVEIADAVAPVRFATADYALAYLQEAAGAYRAVVAHLDEGAKADAWAEVRDCLAKFEGKAGFETEIDLAIGAGAKPA